MVPTRDNDWGAGFLRLLGRHVRGRGESPRQVLALDQLHHERADTVALVDTGLADWVSDLPADEGLVDVDAGTPVRWVEGKGWTNSIPPLATSSAAFDPASAQVPPPSMPTSALR